MGAMSSYASDLYISHLYRRINSSTHLHPSHGILDSLQIHEIIHPTLGFFERYCRQQLPVRSSRGSHVLTLRFAASCACMITRTRSTCCSRSIPACHVCSGRRVSEDLVSGETSSDGGRCGSDAKEGLDWVKTLLGVEKDDEENQEGSEEEESRLESCPSALEIDRVIRFHLTLPLQRIRFERPE